MIDDDVSAGEKAQQPAANDNGAAAPSTRIDAAALTIARLIGRQMAREDYERLSAANDNRPPDHRDD